MRLKILLFIFSFIILAGTSLNAQNIAIHTDKDIYFPGETVWFKGYVVENEKPAIHYTNFYIGLYNEKGKQIASKHYPLFDGTCTGNFTIPDSVNSSVIQLYGFIGNTTSPVQPSKYIRIYNKKDTLHQFKKDDGRDAGFDYRIGGGSLVAGVINYIYCKNIGQNGESIAGSFLLIENDNKIIDSFSNSKHNVYRIQFVPVETAKYSLVFVNTNNEQSKLILPSASFNSVALHTEYSNKTIFYSLQKKSSLERLNNLKVLIQKGDDTLYCGLVKMGAENKFINKISTDSLQPGLAKFMVFDNDNNLLQQKNIFIPFEDVIINPVQKDFSAKGKNVIEVEIPAIGLHNLSAAVMDAAFEDSILATSLHNDLLFANQFPNGKHLFETGAYKEIENSLQFFTLDSATNNTGLKKDDYLSLQFSFESKKVVTKAANLNVVVKDKFLGNQFYNIVTDFAKNAISNGFIFYDTAQVYLQIKGRNVLNNNLNAMLVNNFSVPDFVKPIEFVRVENKPKENLLVYNDAFNSVNVSKKFNEERTIQNVTVKSKYVNPITKRILELDDKYATGMFKGLARGYQFNVIDDPIAWGYSDIFSYIMYKIPAQMSIKREFGARKLYMGNPAGCEVLTFVDESEVPSEMIESISMDRIAYIKFIKGINIGSSFVNSCAVLYIYLKKGDEPVISNEPGSKIVRIKGYDAADNFKLIDYSNEDAKKNIDYRSTLYWNPYLYFDPNKKIQIEYYNNDISKKHIIKIKGFLEDGTLIDFSKIIE